MIIRRILNSSRIYNLFGKIIGNRSHYNFIRDCIGDVSNKRVLDLGCGTGSILKSLTNETRYVGVDLSEDYIATAKEQFANRKTAEFYCEDLNSFISHYNDQFDIIVMKGVMHHISDAEINSAMLTIKKLLAPSGSFHSYDGAYTDNMNLIAKWLLKLDRGQYVRHKNEWIALMEKHWSKCDYAIRTDTLKLPYSVIIFSCSN